MIKEKNNIPLGVDGIYATEVPKDGAAYAAGIKTGDRIEKINGIDINSGSELQEQLSNYKPGDKVNVTYERNGGLNTAAVTLKNNAGNYDIVKSEEMIDRLGADLTTLDSRKAKEYGINGGVVVKKIKEGAINNQTRMRDGFIILKANGKEVKSVEELRSVIGNSKEVKIEGIYPGTEELFEYPLELDDSSK